MTSQLPKLFPAILVLLCAVARADDLPPPPAALMENRSLFSVNSPVGEVSYLPGRGLHLEPADLTFGGYTTVVLEREEGTAAKVALDDLNFFLIAHPAPRLHAVVELGFDDLLSFDENGTGGTRDVIFNFVRMFGDVAISNLLTVRLGTFLTPVGRWNLINASPLTWTTKQPLLTDSTVFDPTTTGAMLFGSTAAPRGRLGYSLFAQVSHPVEDDPEIDPADYFVGTHFDYQLEPGPAFGATFLATERKGDWAHLGGFDAEWRTERLEVLGELFLEAGPHVSEQWGFYLQNAVAVWGGIYLVGRYEHFDARRPDSEVDLFTIGTAYRPFPFMALKAEYLLSDHRLRDERAGFRASFSTLF